MIKRPPALCVYADSGPPLQSPSSPCPLCPLHTLPRGPFFLMTSMRSANLFYPQTKHLHTTANTRPRLTNKKRSACACMFLASLFSFVYTPACVFFLSGPPLSACSLLSGPALPLLHLWSALPAELLGEMWFAVAKLLCVMCVFFGKIGSRGLSGLLLKK